MIRLATHADAQAIADIYNENLDEHGFANCDLDREAAEARAKRIATGDLRHPTFVHVGPDDQILGWASLKPLSMRPTWSEVAEVALYITRASRNRVVGAQLIVQMMDAARVRKFASLIATVLSKNEASLRGLRIAGFEEVARLREAAFLYDQWIDIIWVQKDLTRPDDPITARYAARFRAPAYDPLRDDVAPERSPETLTMT
jgi:L-amino acid N-acyltransferase YncA